MTDEEYIQEPILNALKISPDEKWAAVVLKRALISENRYKWTLDLWNTKTLEKVWSEPLQDGSFWWLSCTEWLEKDEDGRWGIRGFVSQAAISGNAKKPDTAESKNAEFPDYTVANVVWKEKNLTLPDKISGIQVLKENRWLIKAQEMVPQDPDYYETENLPFMEDGKGYIKSFGTLYIYDLDKKQVLRLLSDKYEVKLFGAGEYGIWFTGYERDSERIDFLHSGFYYSPNRDYRTFAEEKFMTSEKVNWETELSEEDAIPRILIEDGKIRIDSVIESGDGWIIAASSMKKHGPGQSPDFWHLAYDGQLKLVAKNNMSTSHAVVRDWKGTVKQFEALPDGVAYLSTSHGEVQIHTCTAGTFGEKAAVSAGGKIRCLLRDAGTIDAFHIFSDGRVMTIGSYEWKMDELYMYEDKARRQISNYHSMLDQPKRSKFSFSVSSCDGKVDVCVLYPKGFDDEEKTKKYPAILSIHGGHKLAYGADVLNVDFKLWTDEGYFVIYCNPRGSEGVDDAFADIIGKNGKADADDILKALDLATKREPQIDRGRIGITGGSYGGYLTNLLITQTNRFACAASIRSISNRISKELDSDTGFRYPLESIGNRVWKQSDAFWDASPIKHIENCHTPTLIVHAEGDRRCPVAEGIQMYTALKLQGVPAKLILFSGESHGLAVSGKPRARLKHSRVIREWFSRYLK